MQSRESSAQSSQLTIIDRGGAGAVDRAKHGVKQHTTARALDGGEGQPKTRRIASREEIKRKVFVGPQACRGERASMSLRRECAANVFCE